MYRYIDFDDRPSASDLFEGPIVDEGLEEPMSPEEEEMLPTDPATIEEPTERHLAFVKRLYGLVA